MTSSPLAWLSDRSDRRVKAGLERKCPTCHARVGRECGWWRGKPERFTPLRTGVIHMIRIPEEILFRRSA